MKMTRAEKRFQVFNNLLMLLLAVTFLLPFIILISSSFVNTTDAARYGSYVLYPRHFDFSAYQSILNTNSLLFNAYKITIFRVVVGTVLNLIFTTMLAYGLSKRQVPGHGLFTTIVIITMFFGGGLIPTYLLMRTLGLVNTFWVLVIPGLVSPWNMVLMRNFFQQIPVDLEEAAMIDGATPAQTLVRVIIPLSTPIIATIALFCAVGHWNAWFDAVLYIRDNKLWPLQLLLRNLVFTASNEGLDVARINAVGVMPPSTSIKCAVILVSTIPILCIYPFLQKYFVKGILVGSLKG